MPTPAGVERRFTGLESARVHVEKRADGPAVIAGYGAVFYDGTPATEYKLWDGAVERIMPTAFDRAIREDDVRGLFNHDANLVLGRTTAKTMRLATDKTGLRYEIDAPDTQLGRDLAVSLTRGDVSGSSFSFIIGETGQVWRKEGDVMVRELVEVSELFDTGPVTFPAYTSTTAGTRESVFAEARASFEDWQTQKMKEAVEADAKAKADAARLAAHADDVDTRARTIAIKEAN